jgi:hypothetical protein
MGRVDGTDAMPSVLAVVGCSSPPFPSEPFSVVVSGILRREFVGCRSH